MGVCHNFILSRTPRKLFLSERKSNILFLDEKDIIRIIRIILHEYFHSLNLLAKIVKEKKKINKSLPPQMEEHYFKRRIITRNLKALLHILNCKYSPHGNLRSRIFAVSWHTIQTNFTNDEAKKKRSFPRLHNEIATSYSKYWFSNG